MQEMKCHEGVWIYTTTWAWTCKAESFISAPKTTSNYLNYNSLSSHSGGTFQMQQAVHATSADFVKMSLGHSCVEPPWPALQWLWFPMQILRYFPQKAGTTHQQCQGCGFGAPEEWIFLLWCWRLPGQRTLCAWPVFFLRQPFTATAGNRTVSSTKLCKPMKCHPCVTVPTGCREHTCHGLGEIQPWLSGSEVPHFAAANC